MNGKIKHMDYNKILDQVGFPPEYNREKAIEAMKIATQPQPAPQELRERAEELLTEASNRDYQNEAQAKDAAINLLLQFAAEVAGDKDRGISELGKKLKDQNSMIADLWETIDESSQRIAELEREIEELKAMNKRLADDDNERYNQACLLMEKDKRIEELERVIQDKMYLASLKRFDAINKAQNEQIAELKKQVEDLHNVIKELRGDITAQELIDGF